MVSGVMGSNSPAYAGMYAGLYSGIAQAQAFTGVPAGGIDGAALFMNNPNVAALKSFLAANQGQTDILNKQQAFLNVIANALNAFGEIAETMDASYNFGGMLATSSDPTVVTAAAGTNAQAGTAVISVTNIALSQSNYSNPVADATSASDFASAYGAGTIAIQAGASAAQTFTVDSTTTLQSLADDINNNTASGVSASVVSTSGGYALQLTGLQTGAANSVTYTETGTTLGLQSNVGQTAVDAQYNLNGSSLTSPTNTVADALQGLTLQLNNASSTPQVVNVALNPTELTNQVQSFVNAFNQVASAIGMATNPQDPANMASQSAILDLQTALSSIAINPSASASGTYSSLYDLGISQNDDGTLSINNVLLQNAIAADPNSVESIFVTTAAGVQGVADQVNAVAQDYGGTGGVLQSMSDSIANSLEAPNFGMMANAASLASYQNMIARQYVNTQVSLAKLQSQNMLVQSLFG